MQRNFPLLASIIFSGCVATEEPAGTTDLARISPNGTSATGISVGGVALAGVNPIGTSARGMPIRIASQTAPLTGAGVVGSTWTGLWSNGSKAMLRIDEAVRASEDNPDLWTYRVSVSTRDGWRPLCTDADGAPGFADAVHGTWNLAQGVPGGGDYHPLSPGFTLACRGSAIAKCVELGYTPWTGRVSELAACVRALRADYCGDGTSYTVDGTSLNIYDVAGIVGDEADWTPEAEWTADGASCVSRKENTRFWQLGQNLPSCFPSALHTKNSCGIGGAGEATIITELPRR